MNKFHFIFLALALFADGSLSAQTIPNGCIKQPPPGSVWRVNVDQANLVKNGIGADVPEVKISVPVRLEVKTGLNGVTQGQIHYSDGRQETYYVVNGRAFLQARNTGRILTVTADTGDAVNLAVSKFPGLGWVGKSLERGRTKKGEEEIVYYAFEELGGDPPQIVRKLEAWVRSSDLQPIEARIGEEVTYRYDKVEPYSGNIALPDNYLPALAKVKKEQAILEHIRKANLSK